MFTLIISLRMFKNEEKKINLRRHDMNDNADSESNKSNIENQILWYQSCINTLA